MLPGLAAETHHRRGAGRVLGRRSQQVLEFRVQFVGMRQQFPHQRRPGLPMLGKAAGRQKHPGSAIAQQIVVIHRRAAQFRHGNGIRLGRRRLAVAQQLARVLAASAAEILAEAALLQLHLRAALVAFQHWPFIALDAELAGLHGEPRAIRVVAADVQLALGIQQIGSHGRAALEALALAAQQLGFALLVPLDIHRLVAGDQVQGRRAALLGRQGIAGAAQKHPAAGGANLHGPAALDARQIGLGRLVRAQAAEIGPGRGQLAAEIAVELVQHRLPAQFASGHPVQLLLHAGGEAVIHEVLELLHQAVRHQFADLGGLEAAIGQHDIAALLNGGDDGRIGGGAPDAALFQLPDQARLAVPRGRLGEMLRTLQALQFQRFARLQVGQRRIFRLLRGRRQRPGVAIEQDDAPANAQLELPRLHQHRGGEIFRIRHLAGDELAADQVIEANGFGVDAGQLARGLSDIGGPNRLMGLLGAALAGIEPGPGWHVSVAELLADVFAAGGDGFAAQIGGIGAHVGDQARFVQPLGQLHGLLDIEAQPGAARLLQGGGDERRIGPAAGGALLAGSDPEGALPQPGFGGFGVRLVSGPEVFVAILHHLETQRLVFPGAAQVGEQLPVFLRREGADFPLPLHDQAHRHGLHPARRQAPGHLGPEQRGKLEAHHPVEEAAGLLGVDPVHVQAAGGLERLADGLAGDLVEQHPPVAARLAADGLPQVPGDGFALPVQVRGQIDRIGGPRQPGQFAKHLLLARQHLVLRRPAGIRVDAHAPDQLLPGLLLPLLRRRLAALAPLRGAGLGSGASLAGRQVAHMADAGLDNVALAQIAIDGARLGRRFDDDQRTGQWLSLQCTMGMRGAKAAQNGGVYTARRKRLSRSHFAFQAASRLPSRVSGGYSGL